MRKLLMCLFIATGILYLSGVVVIAIDCSKRDKEACAFIAMFWPVTITISYYGK